MKDTNNIEPFEIIKKDNELTLKPLIPINVYYGDYYFEDIEKLDFENYSNIIVDLADVTEFDSFLIVFYNKLNKTAEGKNVKINYINASEEQNNLVNVLSKEQKEEKPNKQKKPFFYNYLENIGLKVKTMFSDMYVFIEFTGNLMIALFKFPFKIKELRIKDFAYYFNNAGVNAVPIVILIVFLLGLITGYQGALLLKQFGADRFIADLVGIVIARELGPLMTAILVAGRSGSAYAAEIGTMKVSEEIDALKTMGMDLYQFLIIPRVLAVTIAIPFITILADFAGIVGGLVAAMTALDMTFTGYSNELNRALNYSHLFSGLFKSIIFGFLVSSVGCFRGLQASGGAESVGRFTTAAVVTGVLLIILSDAVFTFLFQVLGI